MGAHWWWWGVAVALAAFELTTATLYLLVLALGAASGGVAAFFGAAPVAQILCAALIALLGWLLIRRLQPRRRKSSIQADPAVFLDVGSRVRVEHWQAGGTARVQYRGASWEAVIEHGAAQPPQPGDYVIRALDGNRLVLGLPD